MRRCYGLILCLTVLLTLSGSPAWAKKHKSQASETAERAEKSERADKPEKKSRKKKRKEVASAAESAKAARVNALGSERAGDAEKKLVAIYQLMGQGKSRQALHLAGLLVRDYPHFQLGQLVYGDLLTSQAHPLRTLGDVPGDYAKVAAANLNDLREESKMRFKALRERPPADTVPSQFLSLPLRNKHAIAVDASRSRLYLFENTMVGLKLIDDFYVSVGKLGVDKSVTGDQRTPLGVYYITSNLDPRTLLEFYGSGALPINYPNAYDTKAGKTGSGIWLHGTPPGQYARAPKATDGCVVLSNPDFLRIAQTVEVRTTPVVVSQQLEWVSPSTLRNSAKSFESVLQAWRTAKASGNVDRTLGFYTADFNAHGKTRQEWAAQLKTELGKTQGQNWELKDLALLQWKKGNEETMVVTFGEVPQGAREGPQRRQYWQRQGRDWKIFYEGVIG